MSVRRRDLEQATPSAWRGFAAGQWQQRIDVRDFIQRNYTPYAGQADFLAGPTQRTQRLWHKVQTLLQAEREKGVL
ncbi:MAG: hypothetical protein EA418_08965, partial [Wenzhouxiangellaceae bacterium]